MSIYSDKLNTLIAILGTAFTWLFGVWDLPLMALVTTMGLDYVTGITRGYITKQLSSEYGFRGLAKKLTIFYVLILAVVLDRILSGNSWVFRTLVCFWYTANEGLSILENVSVIGLPVPDRLVQTLVQLKEGNRKHKEGDNYGD